MSNSSGIIKTTRNPIPVTLGYDLTEIENLVGMAYLDDDHVIRIVLSDAGKGKEIKEILENGATIRNFSMMYIPNEYPKRPKHG